MSEKSPTRPEAPGQPIYGYTALAVPADVQNDLKKIVPPRYPAFKGQHITLSLDASSASPKTHAEIAYFKNTRVEIYGIADDGHAVQCLLARVNGEEKDATARPYHLTWSLDTDADVPAAYNDGKKATKARSGHSVYVASRDEFKTFFDNVIPFELSARFYRFSGSNPIPVNPSLK
jgi:hypothetical protein